MSARRRDQSSAPDAELELPADRRAAFRARGEIHRLLRDVHPQRRADAAHLVGALLDAAITAAQRGAYAVAGAAGSDRAGCVIATSRRVGQRLELRSASTP